MVASCRGDAADSTSWRVYSSLVELNRVVLAGNKYMVRVVVADVVIRSRHTNVGWFGELDRCLRLESEWLVPRFEQVLGNDETANFVVP